MRQDLDPEDEGYESCDDNNGVHSDGCTNTCTLARCGDGITRDDVVNFGAGWEECDDGNRVNDDGCTSACRFSSIADADGFIWDPYSPYQALYNGTSNAWDGMGYLRINNLIYRGGLESVDWARRVYTGQEVNLGGFLVSRRVYVAHPGDDPHLRNFARFYIRIVNPSDVPRSVNVWFYGNLGSDADTEIVYTSDGDRNLELRDTWMVTDDEDQGGSPTISLVYQTVRAPVAVTRAVVDGDRVNLYWNPVSIPARGQIGLIVFAAQNRDRRSARYEAISLSRMGGPALRGLSQADKASLINVRLP